MDLISKGSREDADRARDMGMTWGRKFSECNAAGLRGFEPKNFTLYCHLICSHAPEWMRAVGPLGRFAGQKLEKKNAVVKYVYNR